MSDIANLLHLTPGQIDFTFLPSLSCQAAVLGEPTSLKCSSKHLGRPRQRHSLSERLTTTPHKRDNSAPHYNSLHSISQQARLLFSSHLGLDAHTTQLSTKARLLCQQPGKLAVATSKANVSGEAASLLSVASGTCGCGGLLVPVCSAACTGDKAELWPPPHTPAHPATHSNAR